MDMVIKNKRNKLFFKNHNSLFVIPQEIFLELDAVEKS
jgi:hypothetical protein